MNPDSIFNKNFQEFEQLNVNNKILIIPKNILKLIPYFYGINLSKEWKQNILQINNIDYDLLNLIFIYLLIPDYKIFSGCSFESLIELIKICDLLCIPITENDIYLTIFKNIKLILPLNKDNENLLNILIFLYDYEFNNSDIFEIRKNIILNCCKYIDENNINYIVPKDCCYKLIRNSNKLLISYIDNFDKNELIDIINNNNRSLSNNIFNIVFNKLLKYNYFTTNDLQSNDKLLSLILQYDLFYDYLVSDIFDIISFMEYINNIEIFNDIEYNLIILKILFGINYKIECKDINIIPINNNTAVLLLKLSCKNKIQIIKKTNKIIGSYLLQYFCYNNSICLCCEI
jgi:hypothetical protein